MHLCITVECLPSSLQCLTVDTVYIPSSLHCLAVEYSTSSLQFSQHCLSVFLSFNPISKVGLPPPFPSKNCCTWIPPSFLGTRPVSPGQSEGAIYWAGVQNCERETYIHHW